MSTEQGGAIHPGTQTGRPAPTAGPRPKGGRIESVVEALGAAFRPASVERGDAAALARLAIRYRFDAGTLLLRSEAHSDALWLVEQGLVSVGMPDPQGKWRQTRSVGRGQWLDVASAWMGGDYVESAKASTPVLACEFPLDEVRALCSARPQLAVLFIEVMAARIKQSTDAAHSLAVRDVQSRLAGWLLDHLRRGGAGGTVVILQLKRLLASELGATPETFSRALARLRGLGVVAVKGYTVEVLDLAGLEQLAGRMPVVGVAGGLQT